jgi:hypothetical protein
MSRTAPSDPPHASSHSARIARLIQVNASTCNALHQQEKSRDPLLAITPRPAGTNKHIHRRASGFLLHTRLRPPDLGCNDPPENEIMPAERIMGACRS